MTAPSSYASGWPECTLSYRIFHLQWTLPLCLVLYLLNRPFLTKLDRAKLTLLPIIAFIWTTPWDNLIVKNQAWSYQRYCIWFTIGYIPIEEYFFFFIQSIMTTLWCNLVTRWSMPNLHLSAPADKPKLSILVVPTAAATVAVGLWLASPWSNNYYMAMIVWWSAIPLGLLLWGTIDFVARMGLSQGVIPFLLSTMVPSAYLWASDIYALRRGTWHIHERTSLNFFPLKDLPIEEMVFFVVTNALLVTACFTFDRCVAICRQESSRALNYEPISRGTTVLSPSYLPLNRLSTYASLWKAFIRSDRSPALKNGSQSTPSLEDDLRISLAVLRKASRSFSTASLLLPWDLRTDLSSLYAFCRVADDLVDDAGLGHQEKTKRLELISNIFDVIYPEGKQHDDLNAIRAKVGAVVVSKATEMPAERQQQIRAAACSVIPMNHIVPRRLWDEMLQGYRTDLDFERTDASPRGLIKMDELAEYSQCVAGCVGEMCTRLIMARCGHPIPLDLKVDRFISLPPRGKEMAVEKKRDQSRSESSLHSLLYEARRMGVSLQLVNIARDLVADSAELGRCYLPSDMLEDSEKWFKEALLERRIELPGRATVGQGEIYVKPAELRKYALRLIDISRQFYDESFPALSRLPNQPARAGLRAACSVYSAIGQKIQGQSKEEIQAGKRARMTNANRIATALAAIYSSP